MGVECVCTNTCAGEALNTWSAVIRRRGEARGSLLVNQALDALLGHILSDLSRVQHEWYVEHLAFEQQVGSRLDLKGEKHCESSDCKDFLLRASLTIYNATRR